MASGTESTRRVGMPPLSWPAGCARAARRLQGTPILVLDGGLGTWLEDGHGVVFDATKPAWSSSADGALLGAVHREYLAAGVDVLLTATYQANAANVLPPGCDDPGAALEILPGLVGRAAEAVDEQQMRTKRPDDDGSTPDRRATLALSVGAYGSTMKPSTEYSGAYPRHMQSEAALAEDFYARLVPYVARRTQASSPDESTTARSSGPAASSYNPHPAWHAVSVVAFETLVSATEVRAARAALGAVNAGLRRAGHGAQAKPLWISANFPDGPEDDDSEAGRGRLRAPSGETPLQMVTAMLDGSGPDGNVRDAVPCAVGINCTKLHKMGALVQCYEDAVGKHLHASEDRQSDSTAAAPWLVIYPDGAHNLRYNSSTKTWDPVQNTGGEGEVSWAQRMAELLRDTVRRGKWPGIIVGGCCKTTPHDIKQLVDRLWGPGG